MRSSIFRIILVEKVSTTMIMTGLLGGLRIVIRMGSGNGGGEKQRLETQRLNVPMSVPVIRKSSLN
jgi:hypothetical protein